MNNFEKIEILGLTEECLYRVRDILQSYNEKLCDLFSRVASELKKEKLGRLTHLNKVKAFEERLYLIFEDIEKNNLETLKIECDLDANNEQTMLVLKRIIEDCKKYSFVS